MKLATFSHQGNTSIGLVLGDQILDLPAAQPGTPHDMIEFLSGGEAALRAAASAPHTPAHMYPQDAVQLLARILRPRKYLAIGVGM